MFPKSCLLSLKYQHIDPQEVLESRSGLEHSGEKHRRRLTDPLTVDMFDGDRGNCRSSQVAKRLPFRFWPAWRMGPHLVSG